MTSTGENQQSANDERAQYREQIDLLQSLAVSQGCLDSPINLQSSIAMAMRLQKLAWYNYNLPPKKMKVTNTGHTVVLSAKWFAERPFLACGPLLDNYVFSQVHFHWGTSDDEGSEHTVDDKRYPLEMHTVHFKSDYGSQDEALREKDGLFVLGSFFEIQAEDNPNLTFFINALEHITRPHSSHNVPLTPLSDVIRLFEDDYLLYWGSVMTSQCRHQILWAFSREPIGISSYQVSKFHQILGQNGKPLIKTSRPVHPLAGRTLFHVNPSEYTSSTLLPFANRVRNSSRDISRLGPSYVDQLNGGGAVFSQTQSVYLTDQTTRSIFHRRTAYEDNISDGSDEVCSTTDIMTQMPSIKTVPPTFSSGPTIVSRVHIPKKLEAELRTAVQPLFTEKHKQANRSRKSAAGGAKSDDDFEDAVESFDDLKVDGELELDDIPYQDTDEINRSVGSTRSVKTNRGVDERDEVNDGGNRSVKSKRSVKSNVEDTDGANKSMKSKRSTKSKPDLVDDAGNKSVRSKKSAKNDEVFEILETSIGTNKSNKSRKSARNDDSFENDKVNDIASRMMKSEKSLNGDEYSINDDNNMVTSKSMKSRRIVKNNEDDGKLNQENVIASKSMKSNKSNRNNKENSPDYDVGSVRNKSVTSEKSDDEEDDATLIRVQSITIRVETDNGNGETDEAYKSKSNYSSTTDNRDSNDFDTNNDGSEMDESSEEDISDNDLDGDLILDDDETDEQGVKSMRNARSEVTDKSVKSKKSLSESMTDYDETNNSKKSKKSLKENAGDLNTKSKKSVNDESPHFETNRVKSKKTIKTSGSEFDGKSKKSSNSMNHDSRDDEQTRSIKSKKSIKSEVASIDDTNKSVKSRKSTKSKKDDISYDMTAGVKESAYDQTFSNSPSVYLAPSINNTLPKERDNNSVPLNIRATVEFSSKPDDTRSYSIYDESNSIEGIADNYTVSSPSVVTGSIGTMGLRPSYISSDSDESISVSSRGVSKGSSRVTGKTSRVTDASSKFSKSGVQVGSGIASSGYIQRTSHGTASIGISEGDSHTMLDRSLAPSKLFSDVESDESDDETVAKSLITLKTQQSTKSEKSMNKSKSSKSRNSELSQSPSKKNDFQTQAILAMHVSATTVTDLPPSEDELDVDDSASITTNISCFDVKDHHMSPKGSSAPTTSFVDYVGRYKSSLPDEEVEEMSMLSADDGHVEKEGVTTGTSTRSMKKKSQVGEVQVTDISKEASSKTVTNEKSSRWSWKKKSMASQEGILPKSSLTKAVDEKKSTSKNQDVNDGSLLSTESSSREVSRRKLSVKPEDPNEDLYVSQEPSMKTIGTRRSSSDKKNLKNISRAASTKTVDERKPSIEKEDIIDVSDISREPSERTVDSIKPLLNQESLNGNDDISSKPSSITGDSRRFLVTKDELNGESRVSKEPSSKTVGSKKSSVNKKDANGVDSISKGPSTKVLGDRKLSLKKEDATGVGISSENSAKTITSRKSSVNTDDASAFVSREPSSKTVGSRKSSFKKDDLNNSDDISKDPSLKTVTSRKSSVNKDDVSNKSSSKTVGGRKSSFKKDDQNDLDNISQDSSAKTVTSRKSSVNKDDMSKEPSSKTVGSKKSSFKKDDLNNLDDISKDPSLKTVTSIKSTVNKDDVSNKSSSKTVGSKKSSFKKDDLNDLASRKSSIKTDDTYEIASLFREQQSLTKTLGENKSSTKSYSSKHLTNQSSKKSNETYEKKEESASIKTSPRASLSSGKKEENKASSKPSSPKGSFTSGNKSRIIAFSSFSTKPLLSQNGSQSSGRRSAETKESTVGSARSLGRKEPGSPPSEKVETKSRRSLGKSGEQLFVEQSSIQLQSQNVTKKKVLPWRPPMQFEGYLQTSIDIEQDNIQSMEFPPLEFLNHFNMQGNATVTNEGYTVEIKFPGSKAPLLSGGPLFEGDYEFVGLHLHWGANDLINNHTVDGKLYDMEVHLLHILKDCGSIEKAMKLPHGFSIAAFFLEGADDENPDFEAILAALSQITSPNASTTVSSDVLKLLERRAQPKGYFTYPGSLSIPPYNEVVIWIFYPEPVYVSHRQVAEYRKLSKLANYNMKQQFKPPQTINGKLIFHAT